MEDTSTHWNRLIVIQGEHPDIEIRRRANRLLNQMNTAGGRVIKDEVANFLRNYEKDL